MNSEASLKEGGGSCTHLHNIKQFIMQYIALLTR